MEPVAPVTETVAFADFCATPGLTVSTEPSTFVFEIAAVGMPPATLERR
jgi:hypothetical protein